MNNNKGNTSIIIAIIGVAVVSITGYFMYSSTRPQPNTPEKVAMEDTSIEESSMEVFAEQLAGTVSPYYVFNETAYEQAKAEGKTIILDFYANWCPICRAEAPDLMAGFDQLNQENVVGFRVNYNDTETDEAENALAEEFGVTYQHTKVIIKDGEQVLKDGLVWDTKAFLENVNAVL